MEEVAVLGAPHPDLGQEGLAVVVPKPGRTLDFTALARFTGETLACCTVPSPWELRLEALPRDASGCLATRQVKVMKHVLEAGAGASPLHADEA